MLDRERVVTLDRLDGNTVVERLGAVHGEAAIYGGLLRSTFRTLGQFIGIAHADFLTDAERCRNAALEALQAEAERLGADAVIAVRFSAVERDGTTRLSATGEAVRLEARADRGRSS